MNVAILSPEYPPYTNWGGVATFNYNLAQALSRIGHTVHVITYDGVGRRERIEKKDAIIVHYIRYKTDSRLLNFIYYRLFGLPRYLLLRIFPKLIQTLDWNFFSFFYFINLHKVSPIALIHCTTYHAPSLFVSLVFRAIPCVLYVQGPQEYFNAYESFSIDNQIKGRLENWYTRHCASRIVACSKNVQKKLLVQFPDLEKNILVIPNFINPELTKVTSHPDLEKIVFMGRLEYRKGVDVLLKAFIALAKKNPKVTLFLIGDKKETSITKDGKTTFESAWRSMDIPNHVRNRIIFYPRIDDKQALRLLLESIKGIAVFPSRYEPFGFVTIEAMALGYVVIVGNNSGGKEIIEDGQNGFLAFPTQQSLVGVLGRVAKLHDREIRRITKNARRSVQLRYSIDVAMDQLRLLERSVR